MSIKTLEELCTVSVVENFDTNGAVINIYVLGDKACTNIINRLWNHGKIDNNTVDRLQVHGIETLKLNGVYEVYMSDKVSQWIADVVASGLEELDIECSEFDDTVAKAIVDRYEKKKKPATKRNNDGELKAQHAPAVTNLRTLRIKGSARSKGRSYDHCSRMLSIFASTLKSVEIERYNDNWGTLRLCNLLNAIGTLSLDTLSLINFNFCNTSKFTVKPSMQHLTTLKLRDIRELTDMHVLLFLEVAGPNIQHLNLRGYDDLTDTTLQNIQLHCPKLISLDLSVNNGLTASGLEQFFATASLAKLQRLSLCYNYMVTAAVIAKIAVAAAGDGQLSYLNLMGCAEITKQSLQALGSIQSLKYVDFEYYYMLDEDDVDFDDFMTCHGLEYCDVYDELHPDD